MGRPDEPGDDGVGCGNEGPGQNVRVLNNPSRSMPALCPQQPQHTVIIRSRFLRDPGDPFFQRAKEKDGSPGRAGR